MAWVFGGKKFGQYTYDHWYDHECDDIKEAQEKQMALDFQKKLKFGVLGCSAHYAKNIALPLKSSMLTEPYAVASRNVEKAREYAAAHGFSKWYGSYEELLEDDSVDFVFIPLPNHLHKMYIQKAADAGKPVICEKPICLTAEETVQAAAYCKQRNVPLMEAFMYRFHPQWVKAKEIANSGEIGEIYSIHCHFSFTLNDSGNYRNFAEFGGGALYDIGCYAVSSARFLFDAEPKRVSCSFAQDPEFKADIFASGLMDFSGGKAATFSVGIKMFSLQQLCAVGTGGSLVMELPFNPLPGVPASLIVNNNSGQRIIEITPADQYLLEFEAFAETLKNKTAVPLPPEESVANMAVIDALFKAARSGNWKDVEKQH